MTTVIQKKHIEKELSKRKYKFNNLEQCTDSDLLLSIFCEKVVSLNTSYSVKNLTSKYAAEVQGSVTVEEFVEQKFQQVTTPPVRKLLGKANKNLYIKYTKEGIKERLTGDM